MIEILTIASNIIFILLVYYGVIALDMNQARKAKKVAKRMEEEEAKVEKIIERLDELLHKNGIK